MYLVCITGKPSVKIVFHIIQCLVALKKKKNWSIENYLQSMKNTNKIQLRLIFYKLFSKKNFWKTISPSRVASPINIIFIYNCQKHNFLVSSLSHDKLSHFFSLPFTFSLLSPHTFTVTNSDLSSSHRSLSLSICLSSLFSSCFSFFL